MRKYKGKLLRALAGLAVELVCAVAFVLWQPTDRITKENFRRIRLGMSQSEVAVILGPAGDYRTAPSRVCTGPGDGWLISLNGEERLPDEMAKPAEHRTTDTVDICVEYGKSGVVEAAWYDLERDDEQSRVDNLLWRAERLWRNRFP